MMEKNNLSYRDSAARVVKLEDSFYRYISNQYKDEYDHLMSSGLYSELTCEGILIPHKEILFDSNKSNVYKLILPDQIIFRSYPYEWSFEQWKVLVLTYLRINLISLKYGMILKDATPYNFYFLGNKAILFDTSSFIFFRDQNNWVAYRQFCEEILGPFGLIYFNGPKWISLLSSSFRGFQVDFISNNLNFKSWFNFTFFLHIHVHSKYYNNLNKDKRTNGFSIEKISSLQEMIFDSVKKMKRNSVSRINWNSYYQNRIQSQDYLCNKEYIVEKWISDLKPVSVLDLGANTGKFSFIASQFSRRIISLENDENCVGDIFSQLDNYNCNIFPLIGNIVEPSPTIGLLNSETMSVSSRFNSELVLCLALVHHLFITEKLSFAQIVNILFSFCEKYLVVEFVPINDPLVQVLLDNFSSNVDSYTEEGFIFSFNEKFVLLNKECLSGSNRILYLFEKA